MKKARIILAMLLAVSVFSFAGCGDNDKNANDASDGTTTVEETTDNAADDLKDDAEDLGDDVKKGAEDLVDGTDKTDNGTQNNSTKATTNNQ